MCQDSPFSLGGRKRNGVEEGGGEVGWGIWELQSYPPSFASARAVTPPRSLVTGSDFCPFSRCLLPHQLPQTKHTPEKDGGRYSFLLVGLGAMNVGDQKLQCGLTHFLVPGLRDSGLQKDSIPRGHFLFPYLCVTLRNWSPTAPLQPGVLAPSPLSVVSRPTTTSTHILHSHPQKVSLCVSWKI